MKLVNTLASCILTVQETKVNVRCLSHLATSPKDVKDWVPVTLDELGDTIVLDRRTAELMNGADVEFLVQPLTNQLLGVMIYKTNEDKDKDGGETNDLCHPCEGPKVRPISPGPNL